MLGSSGRPRCKVVATDLDGTILRSDGGISTFTCETVRDLARDGIRVIVVTARPFEATFQLATALHASIAICLSGAVTYDVANRRMLDSAPLKPRQVRSLANEILSVCDRAALGYETPEGRHVDPSWTMTGLSRERMTCLLPDSRSPGNSVLSVLASCMAHAGSCLEDWITHSAARWGSAFSPVQGIVEITTADATKAAALARICGRYEISKHDVVAFGDSVNDLSMLRWAGTGVAVANADDRLRAEADLVTSGNNSDGVASALRGLLADQVIFR